MNSRTIDRGCVIVSIEEIHNLLPCKSDRSPEADRHLTYRLCDLLEGEFPQFQLLLYPIDTITHITRGFLYRYWNHGWHDAWKWAVHEAAQIVHDSFPAFGKRSHIAAAELLKERIKTRT